MNRTRVFIYGSCVSRDIFEIPNGPDFDVVHYVARQSMLSAYSRPVDAVRAPALASRFQRRMIEGDYASSLAAELSEASSIDLMLIDLTDERLGVYVLPDGSVVTRTPELIESGAENDFPQGTRHVPFGTPDHFRFWSDAVGAVGEMIHAAHPRARVILLDVAWAAVTEEGERTPDSFGISASHANEVYRRYIETAESALNAHTIRLESHEVRSSSSHRWGAAPFHYSESVYRRLARAISAAVQPPSAATRSPNELFSGVTAVAASSPGLSPKNPAANSPPGPLPNVIIAGVHRGGTLWLYKQLARHKDIHMASGRASSFFNRPDRLADGDALNSYLAEFETNSPFRWRGERSPTYFWHSEGTPFGPSRPDTPAAISRSLGDRVQILLSLRDPVSRAVSAFWHYVASGRANVEDGIFRSNPGLGIIDIGFYGRHYEHWRSVLGEEALSVLLYDDLEDSPEEFLRSALRALGAPDYAEFWDSTLVRKRYNHHPAMAPIRKSRPVSVQEVAALLRLYQEDISYVERLTGRDLSAWRDLDALVEKNGAR